MDKTSFFSPFFWTIYPWMSGLWWSERAERSSDSYIQRQIISGLRGCHFVVSCSQTILLLSFPKWTVYIEDEENNKGPFSPLPLPAPARVYKLMTYLLLRLAMRIYSGISGLFRECLADNDLFWIWLCTLVHWISFWFHPEIEKAAAGQMWRNKLGDLWPSVKWITPC